MLEMSFFIEGNKLGNIGRGKKLRLNISRGHTIHLTFNPHVETKLGLNPVHNRNSFVKIDVLRGNPEYYFVLFCHLICLFLQIFQF